MPGEPLTTIDHVSDEENVLTSEQNILVGAFITGAINLPEPGSYVFRMNSNDGIRIYLGGVQIWEDPDIHADRMSPPLEVVVEEPGWYEFKVDYYQKKGTSALQWFWTPPGASDEVIVPADALAH